MNEMNTLTERMAEIQSLAIVLLQDLQAAAQRGILSFVVVEDMQSLMNNAKNGLTFLLENPDPTVTGWRHEIVGYLNAILGFSRMHGQRKFPESQALDEDHVRAFQQLEALGRQALDGINALVKATRES
ncbi:MAG: hypothetical protein ACOYL5_17760 [Phototrophicaceae bacterium]